MSDGLFIEEVATRTKLTARTLRFWEEKGLLAPPARTEGGLRLYNEADVARIERIRDLKEVLGLSLEIIRGLLAAEDEYEAIRLEARQRPEPDRLPYALKAITLLEGQISFIAQREAKLAELRQEYEARLTRIRERVQELTHGSPPQAAADQRPR